MRVRSRGLQKTYLGFQMTPFYLTSMCSGMVLGIKEPEIENKAEIDNETAPEDGVRPPVPVPVGAKASMQKRRKDLLSQQWQLSPEGYLQNCGCDLVLTANSMRPFLSMQKKDGTQQQKWLIRVPGDNPEKISTTFDFDTTFYFACEYFAFLEMKCKNPAEGCLVWMTNKRHETGQWMLATTRSVSTTPALGLASTTTPSPIPAAVPVPVPVSVRDAVPAAAVTGPAPVSAEQLATRILFCRHCRNYFLFSEKSRQFQKSEACKQDREVKRESSGRDGKAGRGWGGDRGHGGSGGRGDKGGGKWGGSGGAYSGTSGKAAVGGGGSRWGSTGGGGAASSGSWRK